METNKSELDELSDKIRQGMAEASRKLVEQSAASGRSLVISENGEVKKDACEGFVAPSLLKGLVFITNLVLKSLKRAIDGRFHFLYCHLGILR